MKLKQLFKKNGHNVDQRIKYDNYKYPCNTINNAQKVPF